MTTPLGRFVNFWWILAGFAAVGALAVVAVLLTGGTGDDPTYERRSAERGLVRQQVDDAQREALAEVDPDFAAAAEVLSATEVAATETAAPGTETHRKMMEELARQMAADAAAAGTGGAQQITLRATNPIDGEPPLQFKQTELSATAGEPISLTFQNPDPTMIKPLGHNFVLCRPGKLDAVKALVILNIADPDFAASGYVPDSGDVIAATELVHFGGSDTIEIPALEPGDYPYVCTYPGHYELMKGVLKVTPAG